MSANTLLFEMHLSSMLTSVFEIFICSGTKNPCVCSSNWK